MLNCQNEIPFGPVEAARRLGITTQELTKLVQKGFVRPSVLTLGGQTRWESGKIERIQKNLKKLEEYRERFGANSSIATDLEKNLDGDRPVSIPVTIKSIEEVEARIPAVIAEIKSRPEFGVTDVSIRVIHPDTYEQPSVFRGNPWGLLVEMRSGKWGTARFMSPEDASRDDWFAVALDSMIDGLARSRAHAKGR